MTKCIGATLAVLVLVLAHVPAQASAATWKRCGAWDGSGAWGYDSPGFGFFNVRALNVSCRTARRIVRAHRFWDFESDPDMGDHGGGISYGEGRFWRWHCEHRFVPPEATKTRCLAPGERRVKWRSAA